MQLFQFTMLYLSILVKQNYYKFPASLVETNFSTKVVWTTTKKRFCSSNRCWNSCFDSACWNSPWQKNFQAIIVGTIFPTMIVATAVFFLSVFHSVSNFLGIQLANSLVSGSGSDIPLIQDIETSNSRARLSQATLTFFSLAEQCHTLNLRCFKSNFDAVKSKFDLLIE